MVQAWGCGVDAAKGWDGVTREANAAEAQKLLLPQWNTEGNIQVPVIHQWVPSACTNCTCSFGVTPGGHLVSLILTFLTCKMKKLNIDDLERCSLLYNSVVP